MKKRVFAFISVLLIAAMALSLAGCSGKKTEKKIDLDDVELASVTDELVAEKVGNFKSNNFNAAEGGLWYKDQTSGKYGVMSIEGKYDSGAVYATLSPVGDYFMVSAKKATSFDDIANINSRGLVDGRGKVVVPAAYGDIEMLNDRYAKVMTAVSRVYTNDNALIYLPSSDEISEQSASDQVYYAGTWQIYDIKKGNIIPDFSGTEGYPDAYGNFLKYWTGETTIYANPDIATGIDFQKLFDDGSYAMEERVGDVYSTDGNKLFSYDLTGFVPDSVAGDYYIAKKSVDGETYYAVMDKKGTVVSTEFTDYIEVCGELVMCGDEVFNLKGDNIYEGTFESIKVDPVFGKYYMLRDASDTYTVIKEDGSVVFIGADSDTSDVWTEYFSACQESTDGKDMYFSFADKDYTIEGTMFAPWLIKTPNANNMYNIVNSITGKLMFEGYQTYTYSDVNASAYYVYAEYNGGTDVFLVISREQLAETATKKSNLLDELVASFKAEGINVTVHKETGELAMDSSVLFGGDSAELTADGKAFLNKFIKVYTNVAFSEKYADFISKTMVEGHAAPIQGSTYATGLQLSEDRANNVKLYCLSTESGADVTKLAGAFESVGYSNSQPIYNDDGTVDIEASRRVSFRLLVNVTV